MNLHLNKLINKVLVDPLQHDSPILWESIRSVVDNVLVNMFHTVNRHPIQFSRKLVKFIRQGFLVRPNLNFPS